MGGPVLNGTLTSDNGLDVVAEHEEHSKGLDHDQGLDTQAEQAESPDYLPDGNDQGLDHAGDASGIEEGEADRQDSKVLHMTWAAEKEVGRKFSA